MAGEIKICPSCGSTNINRVSGRDQCTKCGYSLRSFGLVVPQYNGEDKLGVRGAPSKHSGAQ